MFADMGHTDTAALDAMAVAVRPWLRQQMEAGKYLAWLVITESDSGELAHPSAGLGLWLMDWPPHMIAPGVPRANILNVYTAPECRRLGLARQLMDVALAWCRDHGIRTVILHASTEGRTLYEGFGFRPTNEMRLDL